MVGVNQKTAFSYDPALLANAWKTMFAASTTNPKLWENPAYQYDMTDVSRQVLSDSFIDMYNRLVATYTSPNRSVAAITTAGRNLTTLLHTIDSILGTNNAFSLSTWLTGARAMSSNETLSDFYEYGARNQITLWGPNGELSDYAGKSWGGLVSSYYLPRWQIFIQYLLDTVAVSYNETALNEKLFNFELGWQNQTRVMEKSIHAATGGLEMMLSSLSACPGISC
jgi:alpha-N-acetylglucosaminidase